VLAANLYLICRQVRSVASPKPAIFSPTWIFHMSPKVAYTVTQMFLSLLTNVKKTC
jgi:hypothetical protein